MNFIPNYKNSFRILKGGKISLVVSSFLASTTLSFAAPSGGVVTSGSANISQNGKVTDITQSTQKASINWNKFDIASDETVNFKQPNSSSITLNRVVGNEKSIINGALNANGQVWIINSNGVLFGKGASINTSGLLATTKDISDADFQAGNYNFKGNSKESVINLGTIDVINSGSVILAANEVRNEGTIKAIRGKIHLAGADEYTVNLNGNSLVNLTVNKGVLDSLVKNSGTVLADGGEIYLTTNAVDELLKGVVNNTGIIEANSLDGITGKVELFAHGGEAKIGGSITALDGFVETSGKEFTFNDATIKAGEWLIDPVNVTIDDSLATAIETQLASGNAFITTGGGGSTPSTTSGESGSDGNIYVNSEIEWSTANSLYLDAFNNIYINKSITATNDNGKLALFYGRGAANANNTSDYFINAPINLKAGGNFITLLGSDGPLTTWTVVTTASDLQNITAGSKYVLGADIDLINTSWTPLSINWNNAGTSIDGLGHTVSNLTINTSNSYQGLFGWVENASIQNLGLVDSTITGGENTGSLIGFTDTVTLNNVFSNANVNGLTSIGGLIGQTANTNIYNSYYNGAVTSNYYDAGGLVGYINGTTLIENSYALGSVNGQRFIGGLVGGARATLTINNSYADSIVTGSEDRVGGLVGYDGKVIYINNSYARGTITGPMDVGGLVGFLRWDGSTISNSYFSGSVTGTTSVGGLTGRSNGDISNSYAIGSVTGDESVGGLIGLMDHGTLTNSYASNTVSSTSSTPTMIGGVVGEFWDDGDSPSYVAYNDAYGNPSVIQNSYYDNVLNTGAMGDSILGIMSTTQLQSLSTYTDAGWDIEGFNEGSYPTLAWQYPNSTTTTTWVMGTPPTPTTGGTTPTPTPTPVPDPKPDPDPKPEIKKIVDSITNQTATTVNLPANQTNTTTPNNSGRNTDISFSQGENQMLVSRPIEGQSTQRVSLSEARQMQIQNGGSGEEVIVPLSNSSIIQLIDGGVNLPIGVEQEFYLANSNTQEEK